MEGLSCTELANFMLDNGISESVIDNFVTNEVTGECCIQLTEMEMKELAPKIGDRVKLRQLITKHKEVNKQITVISLIFHSLSNMTLLDWSGSTREQHPGTDFLCFTFINSCSTLVQIA